MTRRDRGESPLTDPGRRRQLQLLLVAGLLFAAAFALRVAVVDPNQPVTLLFALPIAIVATELGTRWGLGAGALALGLFALWDLGWASDDQGALDYLARGAVFLVVGGTMGALADRLRRVSEAAEAARAEADRANRAKSGFLSRMSHELRTPLNAIIGFAQLLELDELEPRQREGVEQILKGGRHLLQLINEVLDISRIESGTISLSVEPVHLGSALAEALSLISPLADEANVKLDADPSEFEEVYLLADQQRLKQVLINLLSNAVKYNREGGSVTVGFERRSEERLVLAITDTGPGMTKEQLELLFDPFERLGAERSQIEGTGLGLALSKRLVEIMGGTIEADSAPGQGTTMRVELDTAESPPSYEEDSAVEHAVADGDGAPRARRTVLYIEDNLSNMRLVEQAVTRLREVRLIPAMHGMLGLDLARQHRPDLILLDLHLPDLDGEEVLKRLNEHTVTADIPVVVVSADATPGQIERLRTAGAADYLTKPIDVQRLLELVRGVGT